MNLRILLKDLRLLPKCEDFLTLKTKIEDYLANFEDLTLIFEEIEDSFMCRDSGSPINPMPVFYHLAIPIGIPECL